MTLLMDVEHLSGAGAHAVYQLLHRIDHELHDAFGTTQWQGNLHHVMKTLLDLRDAARQ